MARSYANIYLTIWTDPDFRGLPADAQWLYFTMLTHETLNYCGVMDWRPARLAAMCDDMSIERVENAAWELGQRRMVCVDPDTEEALVRSFVRHDGVLRSPNTAKGMVREFGGVASLKIMELVAREVRRAFEENPSWGGLEVARPVFKQFDKPQEDTFDWVPERFRSPFTSPSNDLQDGFTSPSDLTPQKEGSPFTSPSPPLSLIPYPSPNGERPASYEAPALSTPKRKAPRTPLPASWGPKPRHAEKAREIQRDLDTEAEKFRNDAEANDRRYVLWDRAFDNWLIRSVDWSAPSVAPKPILTAEDIPSDW